MFIGLSLVVVRSLCKTDRNKMSAVRSIVTKCLEYVECGNPAAVLQLKERELKITGASQILAKVLAAPINPADINMIQGTYGIKSVLPAIGGSEGVAEVLQIGSDIKDISPGDWVIATSPGLGFWSTHVLSERKSFTKVPNDMPVTAAATLAVNPCTAYRMLKDFVDLKPGDVVVQNGGNSNVGQGVIQLAREMGLVSINVIRNRPNLTEMKSFLQSLGANYVLTEEEFKDKNTVEPIYKQHGRAKLALNCVGGQSTIYLSLALQDGGKLVTYGGMSKQPLQVPVGPMIFKSIELHGFWVSKWKSDAKNEPKRDLMLAELIDLIKNGRYLQSESEYEKTTLENYADAMKKSMEGFNKKQIFYFA